MKSSRRDFLKRSAAVATMLPAASLMASGYPTPGQKPLVISTWNNKKANEAAWAVLDIGGHALDAVEKGVQIPEADPKDNSVGYGGLPDREGRVTLDACIMDEKGNCGSVVFVQGFMHPISIARLVMEKTPHVILAGKGAEQFALANGFKKENLLTKESEQAWKEWLKKSQYKPTMEVFNLNHDTIGMLALDSTGNLSGACTTSGMAYKMHGRVGDSPIIGAGLFVDNEVGAATATGVGEEVIRVVGSHTIVELLRQGKSAVDACKEAVNRIVKRNKDKAKEIQVAFLAVTREGEYGGFAIAPGFNFTVTFPGNLHQIERVESYFA